ncbi:MAG: nuclear transport factor 2 family protein [Planctomycetota bacterium]|nr:nuclear transport factor 2 family protein [Planctomycetota bacterium]
MKNSIANTHEYDVIAGVVQHYLDGAISGRGNDMKPAFHEDATVFGYVGEDLFAGPIQKLYDWTDDNGPAPGLIAHIAHVKISETVATLRLELDDWSGYRFTDLFTLLKVDGTWKIMNKVFHLHTE